MKILLEKRATITRKSVCGIGSFDGVHRGHKEIITALKKIAGDTRKTGIITFIPLPFFVLKRAPIMYLTLKQEKEQLLREYAVDFVYYFKFTKTLAQLTPQEFVETIAETISPSHIVIGENFHFGKDRSGSAHLLEKLAHGKFLVHVVSRKKDDGTISSTRIRELLLLGNIKAANRLLGRQYTISGTVTKGKGKGTQLGFPTLNIQPSPHKLIHLDGVYKGDVFIHGKAYRSALFLKHDLVEAHVLGFSANLYKKVVTVKLIERMRAVKKFKSEAALRRAIQHDVEMIRK